MNYSKNSSIALHVSTNFFIDDRGKRVYQKGFEPIVIPFSDVVQIMNNKAVAAVGFKGGKRAASNIVEAYPILLEDFDDKDAYQYFETCLDNAGIAFVRVPSRSYADYPYKFHYLIPTDKPLPTSSKQDYEAVKLATYEAIGIDTARYKSDTDLKVAFDRARYLSPAIENEATAAIMADVSKIVYGEPLSVVTPTKSKSQAKIPLKRKNAVIAKYETHNTVFNDLSKWNADDYRKSAIMYEADEVYYLNPNAIIKTVQGGIKLSDFEKLIPAGDIKTEIKTVCPICNQDHSDGIGEGYGWVQRSTTGGDIMLHCKGDHCEGKTFLIDDVDREIQTAQKLPFTNIDFYRLRQHPPTVKDLLLFYLSEAARQGTNIVFASSEHTRKVLKMGNKQLLTARRSLKSLGYIEAVQKQQNGKVWHYTKLIYISGTGVRPDYCINCGGELTQKGLTYCGHCGVKFYLT